MTKEITVLGGRVKLLQPKNGFRTSIDAVLLAAACPIKDGQSLLDLGCGVGSAGLCAAARVSDIKLTGVEIQPDHAELARRNAELNNVPADFVCGDIKDYREAEMDHVICNPPFLDDGTHLKSPDGARAKALGHEDDTSLQDWIDAATLNLKHGGSLTMIHRADHTDKIIQGLGKRFGAIEIIPLWPRQGIAAKRVVIRAVRNRKTAATLHAGIVLHDTDGGYTDEADDILKNLGVIPAKAGIHER